MHDERPSSTSRRQFLGRGAALTLLAAFAPGLARAQAQQDSVAVTDDVIARAEELAGLQFTPEERELMRNTVQEHMDGFAALRDLKLPNSAAPAMTFRPLASDVEDIYFQPNGKFDPSWKHPYGALHYAGSGEPGLEPPSAEEDLLFAPVTHLANWLRKRKLSSTQLTRLALKRLRRLDPTLSFVINYTEDRALEQAAKADEEISHNRWRGPLHGIPWGAKDLLAVEGYPTTWGAAPYRDQMFDTTAEVVRRLDEAGAVLVAKTSVGALAWGDVWFGGTTKNPWKTDQGSSGSSAGSASAVAAGALPFALGTETLGSIVSPCSRCGATGIRPTFGRVPRTGCMALTWSMDKIGPIARRVGDAALVLEAIKGADGVDRDAVSTQLDWKSPGHAGKIRFGYHKAAFDEEYDEKPHDLATLEVLRKLGMDPVAVELPDLPVGDMLVVLEVEAAAAFDELTRSNRDDELTRQVEQAWPNVFRAAQLVPAVQYVQAMRAREKLVQAFDESLGELDGYLTPSFHGGSLSMTNLTGHPTVVLPNGFREDGTPTSICFVGRNYGEGPIAAVAAAYQEATDWHLKRPKL